MNILIYLGHPAQYLFLRETINRLHFKCHKTTILIKTKDVLENLLKEDGLEYVNILPRTRGNSKFSILCSLIKRILILFPLIIKEKPNLLIGSDAPFAILGKILRINRITVIEDDYQVIKTLGDLTYPFTQTILCPEVCDVGKWTKKKVGYSGYMKLAYLHPNIFNPDNKILSKYNLPHKYAIIRLSKLNAHHDFGITGIDKKILDKIITLFNSYNISVYISSEGNLENNYSQYLLKIKPQDMHQVLFHATILVSDSQSMSVEAAILGVPSIRVSSFIGKISVLEELEHKYELTYGFLPEQSDAMFGKIEELLNTPNLKEDWQYRRQRMLQDKIDVTAFMVWFIENYPDSVKIMKENPNYQYNFK